MPAMDHIMNNTRSVGKPTLFQLAAKTFAETAACSALRQPVAGLRAGSLARPIAFARQMAMYLAHTGFGLTLTEVGLCFQRDRTTVRYACALIEDHRDGPPFDLGLAALETGLRELAISTGLLTSAETGR